MAKLRAFIVEDSPLILQSLTQALEKVAGVEVVASADDEQSALAWMDARSNGCDIVILDVFLKTGSGLGVLKGMAAYAEPPARVVLTNYATSEMRARCEQLGAEVVFDKSSQVDELLDWLTSCQSRSRLH